MKKHQIIKIHPRVISDGYRHRVLDPFRSVRNYTLMKSRRQRHHFIHNRKNQ